MEEKGQWSHSQTLKSEANISQKFSKTLIQKPELTSERIKESSKSMCLDEGMVVFKPYSS